MTDREIIASFCGTLKYSYALPTKVVSCDTPKYDDLEEINHAENKLNDDQFEFYRWILWGMCKKKTVKEWSRAYLSANADLRREALVSAIKQFKENKIK